MIKAVFNFFFKLNNKTLHKNTIFKKSKKSNTSVACLVNKTTMNLKITFGTNMVGSRVKVEQE